MNSQNKKKALPCPECDTPLSTPENPSLGLVVECAACGIEVEFVKLHPLTLAPLEEEK